jgi:hypothetical protein
MFDAIDFKWNEKTSQKTKLNGEIKRLEMLKENFCKEKEEIIRINGKIEGIEYAIKILNEERQVTQMKKVEVGEYIRTAEGIFKVIAIDKLYIYLDKLYFDKQYQTVRNVTFEDRIVQHSFNLKELINENDIVEYRINSLSELKVGRVKKYRDARSNKQYMGIEGFDITKIYILSVLIATKYKQECYVVEDEKDE